MTFKVSLRTWLSWAWLGGRVGSGAGELLAVIVGAAHVSGFIGCVGNDIEENSALEAVGMVEGSGTDGGVLGAMTEPVSSSPFWANGRGQTILGEP